MSLTWKQEVKINPKMQMFLFGEISLHNPQGQENVPEASKVITPPETNAPCSSNADISLNLEKYQGPDSFEKYFRKFTTEIGRRFGKLPAEIRSKDLAEILGASDYAFENEMKDEMNRLWFLGLSQDEAGVIITFQAFRGVIIRWYGLWLRVVSKEMVKT